jgi:hypothetical protein
VKTFHLVSYLRSALLIDPPARCAYVASGSPAFLTAAAFVYRIICGPPASTSASRPWKVLGFAEIRS